MGQSYEPPKSEAYFRQLTDSSPQLIWACSCNGQCEFLNQQWLDYTGVASEDQLGGGWLRQFHADDFTSISLALRHLPADGNSLRLECRIRRYDGTYRWFDTRARLIRDASGAPTGWCGSSTDIVDSRRAVASDAASDDATRSQQYHLDRAYLAAIVNNSSDAIVSKTVTGKITSWNKAAEQIFGYTADEVIGKSITVLFPPERIAEEADILACINAGQEVRHYLTQRMHKNGRMVEVSVSISPIFNEAGKIVGIAKVARDITAQKSAERRLQESHNALELQVNARTRELQHAHHELQSILDAMPALVSYWDKNLINRFSNRTYAAWFNDNPMAHVGRHIREVMGEERYRQNSGYIQAALRGELQVFERSIPSPDGTQVRHVLVHYIPDFHVGKAQGFYALVYDVTALKQAEAALKGANYELEAFSYAVAHDLRAPLRAMIGFSEALQEECANILNMEAQDYLLEIIQASKRMGQLIDGLLALSRSTQGQIAHHLIDMSGVVENLRKEYQLTDQGSEISWYIESGLFAWGDSHMIETVLRNLIDNACKYASRVAKPEIRFYSQTEAGVRNFCIADNGAGFDMAYSERLFKPFQRLHRQDEFVGIGIGLATVKRIVQRHGGNIDAISAPGRGATFYFTLGKSQVTGTIYESANSAS